MKLKFIILTTLICSAIFLLFDFIEFKILGNKFYGHYKNLNIQVSSYLKYYDDNWFGHSVTSYQKYYKKISNRFTKSIYQKKI